VKRRRATQQGGMRFNYAHLLVSSSLLLDYLKRFPSQYSYWSIRTASFAHHESYLHQTSALGAYYLRIFKSSLWLQWRSST
ncbi:hypothetical protein XENORESO_004870, partial [Xenotaenia resolanae]